MDKRTPVQEQMSQAAAELSDASHRRWSPDTLTAYVNEALRRLADEGAFRRTDLHPARAGVGVYRTLAEPVGIGRVFYEGRELRAATEAELERAGGPGWRSRRGRPARFQPLSDGVRLYPAPDVEGAMPSLPALPLLSEEDGAKIDADGWAAANSEGGIVHFREDDPGAPDFAGGGLLRIDYAFYPRPSASLDSVPTRLAEALRLYLLHRCLASGETPEEAGSAEGFRLLWLEALSRAAVRSGEAARAEALWFAPVEAL